MTIKKASRIPLDDLLVFHQVARSLTSSFDLDTILRTIIEHMERFIEADLWTLLMLDEERQELYYAITAGGEDALRCAICASRWAKASRVGWPSTARRCWCPKPRTIRG
jgi:GAF domain-containing protein